MRSLIGFVVEAAIKPRILDSHVESVEKLLLCEANVLIIRRNSGGRNVVPLPSGPRDSSASFHSPRRYMACAVIRSSTEKSQVSFSRLDLEVECKAVISSCPTHPVTQRWLELWVQ